MIGKNVSHYKILDKLGEGGMGIVYKAMDTKLDRFVALKFLPPHLSGSTENKARFVQEAKSAAALNHPNILAMYEIDEWEGSLFLVMEFIEGQTLRSYQNGLGSGVGIPVLQTIDWILQLAQGLKSAHDRGIIHRDIKPQNVMLTNDGRLKIMDFGLAKLMNNASITKTGTSLGTISYMSPEQVQGLSADHRSDIWSLGVVFYEMLTGELPFKAEHEAALLYLIVNENPPAPSMLDKKISHHIDLVIDRMLTKDREKRYQSIDELVKAIESLKSEMKTTTTSSKVKAIAVLPFGNISPDKESDYFSDGLTEELIANLARLKDMRVVPRATSMQYKGTTKDVRSVARELGTRYILSGSVRKFQDNLRITVELIDVDTDTQLWAETYKGKLADVFDIQEQVSKQIVDALMVKLTPTEKVVLTKRATLNPQAFDCNLRARESLYRYTKNGIRIAIQLFQKALEYDSRYADAYAGLGEAYATLYQTFERKEDWLDKALEAGLKALMYDPTLSEAYTSLGLAYLHKKSHDEAFTASRKAIELDPNNYIGYWILGRICHTTDRDREAIDQYKKVISLNPDFYSAYSDLMVVYERLGEKDRYQEILQSSLNVYPRYLSQHADDARAYMFYAIALTEAGKIEEAKKNGAKAIELSPDDPLMLYNASCFYSRLGEKQRSLNALKNAIALGYEFYEWIKRDPDMENIRNEPEYIELMKGK